MSNDSLTVKKIRRKPLHRMVRYLLNEEHWASVMADHYFKRTIKDGLSCDGNHFEREVSAMTITLDEFLGRDWL